uniref:SAM-dependent methyltransferase n=1 Tax=Magnetococcus massalia (strain MO-1) TaxID=451514 RepID=A0A1S7LKJ9_MAGMO|nr:Conserved protein of unknown function [Candidatus Magnetococcus massalia]
MSISDNPLLQKLIEQADKQGGVIPYHQFMRIALYDPEHGYYMRPAPRLGPEGDFVTAPEITSLFGELLTLQFIEVWQRLGMPESFKVVEVGAGSGKLAVDLLKTAQKFAPFAAALDYAILEKSLDFRKLQRESLAEAQIEPQRCRWIEDDDALIAEGPMRGVLYGNEILDAFPVHWMEKQQQQWREIGARWDGACWQEEGLLDGQQACIDYLQRFEPLPDGFRTEVCLDAQRWVKRMAENISAGVMLFIDYGYTAKDYYQPGLPQGTLMAHYKHKRIMDPWLHPGEMDLTAHVDFSAMAQQGRQAGLETYGYTSQGWFLMGLGILQRLEQVMARSGDEQLIRQLKQSVARLVMPDAMGERFKVLAMGRGLRGAEPLAGFSQNNKLDRL